MIPIVKILCFILTIVTAVIAIDVRFMNEKDCKALSFACANLQDGYCCRLPKGKYFKRVAFAAVPGSWHITMRGMDTYDCDLSHTLCGGESNGKGGNELQSYCYEAPSNVLGLISGQFFTHWRKSSTIDSGIREGSGSSNCTLVDTLITSNGTRYGLQGLDETAVSDIVRRLLYLKNNCY